MKNKKRHEKYPKDILFYLEEFEKKQKYKTRAIFEEDINLNYFEIRSKYEKLKDIDDLKDKINFIYFDENFKSKAKNLIKEDEQKKSLLSLIESIDCGNKSLYNNEKFKCCDGFLYSLFIAKNELLKVNFGIFFEKTPRQKPYSTYIEKLIFFDLTYDLKSSTFSETNNKILYNFEQKFGKNNDDLEFDKMIILGEKKERLFYYMVDEDPNKYFLFPFELKTKNEVYKKVKIFDKEYIQGFDMKIWDLKYPIDNVINNLNELNSFHYNQFFEKDVLNFHPSKIETKLINMNNNFILSGRPGTGKTVVILIKVIMYYLNCLFEHSKLIKGKVDYDFINTNLISNSYKDDSNDDSEEDNINNLPTNKMNIIKNNNLKEIIDNNDLQNFEEKEENSINENNNILSIEEKIGSEGHTYKIIFTSLSQNLCEYVENYFIQGIKNSQFPLNILPTNQKTYEKISSFATQKKYPLFLNFRKLLFMIDGSLNYQFFDRPNNNQLKKRQEDCDIRYYPDCEYDVMADLSILINKPGNKYFYRRKYLFDPLVMKEINEDTFYNNFKTEIENNKILNNEKNKISCYEVYSNIISIIKGSVKSYLTGYLSREEYNSLGKKICPFNTEQKNEIYNIFERYELWKSNNKYFDMQDIVNYLIREVNIELVPQNRKLLDLVFVDEAQDFSINQLYLLYLISRDIKVLAGDTCQTISKINNFRFADLNSALYTIGEIENIKINEPKHIEINLNFRCQANILKFSHILYEMIRYFFSNTLDKVRIDFSTQVGGGEKPFLIPYKIRTNEGDKNKILENKTGFDYFLKRLTDNNLFLDDKNAIINLSFSVNHCVICRNNSIVKKLNEKYNNKIFCSTIYESKGLEYEIVIIYNFFQDSIPLLKDIWKFILKNISFKKVENNYLYLIKQNLEYENYSTHIKDEIYSIFKEKFRADFPQSISEKFSLYNFCSELKELYSAVTRAKSRLYFYEENMELLKLFIEKIDDLDILSQKVFIKNNKNNNIHNLVENYGDNFSFLNKKVNGLLKFINKSKTTKDNLYITALNEYNQDNEYNYKKALYLFQVLDDEIMKNKSLINLKFIEMQKIKESNNSNKDKEFMNLNNEILELINKINYDDYKQIKGEVLINLNKYDEALEYYIAKKNHKKCGIVLIKWNRFEEALKYFKKAKNYSFAVYCLLELKQYKKLYLYLLENTEQFDLEHIQYYYKITCDKFFKNYSIPIKNLKKLLYKINDKNEKNENLKKKEELKMIEIKNNIITKDSKEIKNINNNYSLLALINDQKIKIKNPFIAHSKSNDSIFDISNGDKNNIYNIIKTKEEIVLLINYFKDLINFMLIYLQTIINKIEKTENQESFILNCKTLISYIEEEMKKDLKEMTIDELLKILDNLRIIKHEYKVIIKGILKNIGANEYIYTLYDIYIFKINILEHILADLPILYQRKKYNKRIQMEYLDKESIEQIVKYSKYLPISENDIIKNIKSAFILSHYFEGLLGIISKENLKELIELSIILRKKKLFELIIKKLDIDFIKGEIKNKEYKDIFSKETIFTKTNEKFRNSGLEILYYLNNYISMNIEKFFKYFFAENKDKEKINIILDKIEIFPKIHNILIQLNENNNNNKLFDYIELSEDINEFYEYIMGIGSNKNKNINYEKLLKLISIGTEISLITYLYGHKKISIELGLINNEDNNRNRKVLNIYIVIISKILDIEKYAIDIKNEIPVYSLLNAFGIYSINDYLSSMNLNYNFIKKSEIIKDAKSLNYELIKYKECFLKKNIFLKESKKYIYFDTTNNIYIKSNSFPIILRKNITKFINKILDSLEIEYIKNSIDITYKFIFNLLISTTNIIKKMFSDNYNQIIIYLSQNILNEGEYYINEYETNYYYEQSRVLCKYNKLLFYNIAEIMSSEGQSSNNNIKLINYLLFSNLIGGMIKIDYQIERKQNIYKFINNYYLEKDFSYINALKLINEFYHMNLNQLLIVIWLRKIYNCFYTYIYNSLDDKNKEKYKLYIYKNSSNRKLNISIINDMLSKNKNEENSNIDIYLTILYKYIKIIKKNLDENNLENIKIYLSEIYNSLITLDENMYLKFKIKVKLIINEIENSFLLINDETLFKKVYIINDIDLKNNISYNIYEIRLDFNKEEINEEYEEESFEDYDGIEESLLKNLSKSDKYY